MKLDMMSNNSPGILITFCGLDGSGKTTLIRRLKKELEQMDLPVSLTKQPTDFVRRSAIFRTYMDFPEHSEYDYRALSLLCASDRIQHCNRGIRPLLEQGQAVISDRYFYSCLANLRARGYTEDAWIYEVARSIPRPDIAFFLDIDPDTAIRRVRERPSERQRFIDVPLQYRLRGEFLDIARDNGGVVISTNRSEDDCYSLVRDRVMEALKRV